WSELAELATHHGVQRMALELVPPNLVYNAPTLLRLRDAVGPVIGANIDPGNLFWQQIDPTATVEALGPAAYHVHLKDLSFNQGALPLTGVLDTRLFRAPKRSWRFCVVGQGHRESFWQRFFDALRRVGYDDVLSIENEDAERPGSDGVRQALAFVSTLEF